MKASLILLLFSISLSSAQLKISSDGHYLRKADGTPVYLVGVAPWDICNGNVRYADLMQEIDSCVTHHLNFWQVRLPSPANFGGPANGNGVDPWIGAQTFASVPNEPYWRFVDTVLGEAGKHGIYVQIYPDYLGGDASQGWQRETENSSMAEMYAWGQFLGNRYKDSTNILWGIGGDCVPGPYQAKLDTMAKGIRSYDPTHLMSTRDEQGTTTDTYWNASYTWKTLAGIYPYWNTYSPELIYRNAWAFYNRNPVQPAFGQEFWYENEHNTTTQTQLRQQIWYCALSGLLAGEVFGNCPEWNFGANNAGFASCGATTWQAELNSQGHINQKVFAEIFTVRNWWKLVPDTSFAVADSGYGTNGDATFCPVSHASDSSCIIAYLPSQHQIRIKLSYVKGDSVTCRWYDPATGSVISLGNRARIAATFNPPSPGDWVFVAERCVQITPDRPVLLAPDDGATGVPRPSTLTWNASTGATSYHLQVSADSAFATPLFDQSNISTTSCTVNGFAGATLYYWHVNASNSMGTSPFSTAWSFVTAMPPLVPQPPVLTAPTNGSTGVATSPILIWNMSTGATSYRVQVSIDSAFSTNLVDRTITGTDSLALSNLVSNTTFYWRASAIGSGGTSAYSTVWSFTTIAPPLPPGPPALATPANGSVGVTTGPTLTWNVSPGATSYRVQVAIDSAFKTTVFDQANITVSFCVLSGLTANRTYYWHVSATNAGGTSVYSSVWSFTTAGTPSGLVAAYAFDEGTGSTVMDVSGHGLNGTISNATWTSQGKYAKALVFNGTTGYVDLGNPVALQITGSMTWSAWVKGLANPPDDGQIIARSDDKGGWQLKSSPDTGPHTFGVAVCASNGSHTQRYSTTVRSLNTWYYVAGVYNATARTLDIYVNGVLDNGTLRGTVPALQINSNVNVNIGRRSGGFYFNGIIDEVRIYNRALTQAEIQLDMNTPLGAPPVPPLPPVLVTPLNGAVGVATSPTFTWTASTGATSYRVQVSADPVFGTTVADQSNVTVTSYTVNGLGVNTLYYWRVSATNTGGTSGYAGAWSFTTVAPPSPPVLLTPANGATAIATSTPLTWNASTGAASYHVQVSTDSAFRTTFADTGTIASTSYPIVGLATNTMYYWHVSATNNGGTGPYSAPWRFTTVAPPPPPLPPLLATPSNGATGIATSTTLTWNASTGATSYHVQVSTDSAFRTTIADTGAIASTSYPIVGLVMNTMYYWHVSATNNGGTGPYSAPWGFTTVAPPPPPLPPLLATPSNGATGIATSTTLTWNASTGAVSYHVQVSTDSAFRTTIADTGAIASTSYPIVGLVMNTMYYWHVSATNNGGTGPYSAPWRFTTVAPPPPPLPPPLATPSNGATGIATSTTLTWNASTGAVSYHVQVSTDSAFRTTVADTGTIVATTCPIVGLAMNTIYYWRVSATNGGGTGAYSAAWNFATLASPPPPLPPVLATPAQGATGVPTSPTLTWTASTGATSYHVQVSTDSLCAAITVDQNGVSMTSTTVSGLASNTTYYWHVNATNSGGTSAYSVVWRFTTAGSPPGLVAAYAFSEGSGTTVVDASGHGLAGTISGATWTTLGRYGSALSFNGTNSYVDLGNPALLQITGSMTLSAWVKAAANPTGDAQIIAKSNSTYGWQLKTRLASGSHTFGTAVSADTRSRTQRYGSTVRSLNTWYHVAGVYNATSKTLDVYVNGALDNGTISGSVPALLYNSGFNVNIGRQSSGNYFNGVIDEVRIYNRALTLAEIQSDMNTPLGPPPPPLPPVPASPANASTGVTTAPTLTWTASPGATSYGVQVSTDTMFATKVVDQGSIATTSYTIGSLLPNTTYYWHVNASNTGRTGAYSATWSFTTGTQQTGLVAGFAFDEGSGTTVADVSGDGLTGTISGATWATQGRYGKALSFNGSSNYVDLGNPALLKITGSMTLSAWVNATANPPDDGQIIAKSNNACGWQLKTTPDTGPHTFGIAISASSTSYIGRHSTTVRSLGTWYFVAGVYNATARTLDMYVNGVLDNGVLVGTVPAAQYDANLNVNIGRRSGGFYFNGLIDEVRINSRALTQSEIQADMNTPLGGSSLRRGGTPPGNGTGDSSVALTLTNAVQQAMPAEYALEQNYPNPFNPSTTIRFAIQRTAMTEIVVYDIVGREIAVLASGHMAPGYYAIRWDGTNSLGGVAGSGVYFVRMTARADDVTFRAFRKVLMMK